MIEYEHWKLLDSAESSSCKWEILGYPRFTNLAVGEVDYSRIIAQKQDVRDALLQAQSPYGYVPIHPVVPIKHVRITLKEKSSSIRMELACSQ